MRVLGPISPARRGEHRLHRSRSPEHVGDVDDRLEAAVGGSYGSSAAHWEPARPAADVPPGDERWGASVGRRRGGKISATTRDPIGCADLRPSRERHDGRGVAESPTCPSSRSTTRFGRFAGRSTLPALPWERGSLRSMGKSRRQIPLATLPRRYPQGVCVEAKDHRCLDLAWE